MSSTSIENAASPLDWLEEALIVIKENLAIYPVREYSKIANLVKIYLRHNQKTPEDLFNCLNNKSLKRSIDNILLGFSLEYGIGTLPNLTKAFLEFQKAANAEDSFGQFFLGRCYDDGIGTSQDREKAFKLYSKAVEAGDTNAQKSLGNCYFHGWGTTKSDEKGFELYSKAAEAGHLGAQYNLAVCYANGWGTTKNSEKAFELYSKAAETGYLDAQYNLAVCYANGEGTIKNSEKAFELYSKLAEAGNTRPQYNLAVCYANGEGTMKNSEKAFEFYLKAAEGGDSDAQYHLARCYDKGLGTTRDSEKAFELYSKAAEAGSLLGQIGLRAYYRNRLETTEDLGKEENPSPQTSIGTYYRNERGIVKNLEETFQFYLKTAEEGNQNAQYNLGWCYQNGWGTAKNLEKTFELYLKAAEANNLCYQSDFPDLNVHELTLEDQDNLEYTILRFQNRGFKYLDHLKGEFLDFEAFFDKLSDEFKCFKCGNLGIIISGSPICPFCDTDKSDNIVKAGLPKCLECDGTLKNPLWCKSCEYLRYSESCGTWNSGNDNIDLYIDHVQRISASCREFLEWISPDEITFLDEVGTGGFGIVKEGRWERGRILFWDKKNQKYERTGVTKVALKCLKDSQNIEYINSDEFIAHLTSASCKYILECYGITKDVTTDGFVMVLPFAEHGDLRAFLKLNEDILTWDMFLRILFQIAGGLRFIHESKLVHGDLHPGNILVLKTNPLKVVISDLGLCRPADYAPQSEKIYGVLEYLAPEICKGGSHTKYSDIYSFAIISCEIISGERPLNNTDSIYVRFDVIDGKRPTIKKHTPQCIQKIIEKNWQYDSYCRDSAEELQQRVIAARNNCNLNEPVREKRLNTEEIEGAQHDSTRYKSQLISNSTFSMSDLDCAISISYMKKTR
ncbi:hypothetical protein G9A89_000041 [Geosiphon pyriformis]|nr:hypothetical protein G9A89_000041 [Geosiphon pyriformis]